MTPYHTPWEGVVNAYMHIGIIRDALTTVLYYTQIIGPDRFSIETIASFDYICS